MGSHCSLIVHCAQEQVALSRGEVNRVAVPSPPCNSNRALLHPPQQSLSYRIHSRYTHHPGTLTLQRGHARVQSLYKA